MNEQIKKLIEQATTIEHGVDNGFDRVTFDKEKFAQLIVQECVNVVSKATASPTGYRALMKHFGVSE
jgi:hypothetical protein